MYMKQMATKAEEVAHPEIDTTVWVNADPDPIVRQKNHTGKTVLTKTTNPYHIVNSTIQTLKTGRTHLIESITTIGKDPEVIHLWEAMITKEIASQLRKIISARAGQTVEVTHFTLKLRLST